MKKTLLLATLAVLVLVAFVPSVLFGQAVNFAQIQGVALPRGMRLRDRAAPPAKMPRAARHAALAARAEPGNVRGSTVV